MTSNKLAVKLELAWHELSDLDSIKRMAEAPLRKERRVVNKTKGDNMEVRMMANMCRREPSRQYVIVKSFLVPFFAPNALKGMLLACYSSRQMVRKKIGRWRIWRIRRNSIYEIS